MADGKASTEFGSRDMLLSQELQPKKKPQITIIVPDKTKEHSQYRSELAQSVAMTLVTPKSPVNDVTSPALSILSPRYPKSPGSESGKMNTQTSPSIKSFVLDAGIVAGLWRSSSLADKIMIIFAALMSCMYGLLLPVLPFFYGAVQAAFEGKIKQLISTEEFQARMMNLVLIFCATAGGAFILGTFSTMLWSLVATRIYFNVTRRLFESLLRKSVPWFEKQLNNEEEIYVQSLFAEAQIIHKAFAKPISILIKCISTMLFAIGLAFYSNAKLAAVMISITLFATMTMLLLRAVVTNRYEESSKQKADAASYLDDVLRNIRVVVAYGGHDEEVRRFEELEKCRRKTLSEIYTRYAAFIGFANFLLTGSFALSYWYGGVLISGGEINAGQLLQIFILSNLAFSSINEFSSQVPIILEAKVSSDKIYHIINDTEGNQIIPGTKTKIPGKACKGEIVLDYVSFAYPMGDGTNALSDVSMEISPGQHVAIVGLSGSGKSTLVQLIQGFYKPTSGQLLLDGVPLELIEENWLRRNVCAVSQEPFLFNTTVRENLVLGQGFSDTEVREACQAADVHDFLLTLPQRYDTHIGQYGGLLSGGQKQRIVLARAILRKPKVLILDEATSYLDVQTESNIVEKLRAALPKTTIISVAHRLSALREVDRLYVMSKGGIIESGSPDNLLKLENGFFRNLHELMSVTTHAPKEEPHTSVMSPRGKSLDGYRKSMEKFGRISFASNRMSFSEPVPRFSFPLKPIKKLLKLASFSKYQVGTAAYCALMCGLCWPAYAAVISFVFSSYTNPPDTDVRFIVMRNSLLFLGLGSWRLFGYGFRSLFSQLSSNDMASSIRIQTFKQVLNRELGWFDDPERTLESLTKVINEDPVSFQLVLQKVLPDGVEIVAIIIGSTTIAFFAGWKLAFIGMACVPVILFSMWLSLLAWSSLTRAIAHHDEQNRGFSLQFLDSIRTVVSLNIRPYANSKFGELIEKSIKSTALKCIYVGILNGIVLAVPVGCEALMLYFSVQMFLSENYSFFNILLVLTSMIFSSAGITAMSNMFPEATEAYAAAHRILPVFSTRAPIVVETQDASDLPKEIKGNIEFSQVSFSYPARPDQPILKQLKLKIPSGETFGIVAKSGTGKSTLLLLLMRLYRQSSGSIYLDGVNIKRWPIKSYRRIFGWVPQEPSLLSRTIKENIAYASELDDEKVKEAAKKAKIHEVIEGLPEGYDTKIGSLGLALSGGQKQRISIARAIYRDPNILLLDEYTSSLDNETERDIIETVKEVSNGKTVLIVAHRLATIVNSNKVAVIKNGIVSELDSLENLMQKKGDLFDMFGNN